MGDRLSGNGIPASVIWLVWLLIFQLLFVAVLVYRHKRRGPRQGLAHHGRRHFRGNPLHRWHRRIRRHFRKAREEAHRRERHRALPARFVP